RDQIFRQDPHPADVAASPTGFDLQISALRPARPGECLDEFAEPGTVRLALGPSHQHADVPHGSGLLRRRRGGPRGRRAAEQTDELAAFDHSITSSAMTSSCGGTATPKALAVLVLITSSNLVARTIGRSRGFSPFRMRPA